MPTGWRPKDVAIKFPLEEVNAASNQIKYKTENSSIMLGWSWLQHIIAGIMMFHLFLVMNVDNPSILDYFYGLFIIVHIFSFTAMLDYSKYSIVAELFKITLGSILIYGQNNIWFNLGEIVSVIIISYLIISLILTINFYLKRPLIEKSA